MQSQIRNKKRSGAQIDIMLYKIKTILKRIITHQKKLVTNKKKVQKKQS